MALFQKQPLNLSQNLPYTISLSKNTVLIAGLGNPGKEHALTRHNAGFIALDKFAEANGFEAWQNNAKFKAQISDRVLGSTRVILVKPQTYMNLSGDSVRAVASYYKVEMPNTLSIYDEISIPFGHIRTRIGGQSAGHNGVKSLIEQLGPDFGRLRIGIKNTYTKEHDQSDFVLTKFTKEELETLPSIISEACSIITEFIFNGQLTEETRKVV